MEKESIHDNLSGHNKTRFSRFTRSSPTIVCIALTLFLLAIWQITEITREGSLNRLAANGDLRVNYYRDSLRDSLEKYRHIPYMMARDIRVLELLRHNIPSLHVSQHLEDFSLKTGALMYILDRGGTTVAASNWRDETSLMGYNFSFRPYYIDAMEGKEGGYYAVGMLTLLPGYFLSYPVRDRGEFIGAIVVKLNLEPLQQLWQESGETVIVSDASGVIFLSSNTAWKYKSLRKLPPRTISNLQATQYINLPLQSLSIQRERINNHNIITIDGVTFTEQARPLPHYGWRIHYLSDLKSIEEDVNIAITSTTIAASLLFFALLYLRERRQKNLSLQEAKKTAAIRHINEKLLKEIEEHKKTEQSLRETQSELIQAGKLAALGRMSAAIAHELNQPVTAIRTFIASTKLLIERKKHEEVITNLQFISGLTDRMGNLTGQLKTFARKSKKREEVFNPIEVINRVVLFLQPQCNESNINVQVTTDNIRECYIKGDSLQLEQVVSNLMNNSIDALEETEDKVLQIQILTADEKIVLRFSDSGMGIPSEARDTLFDPFYTTKEVGKGLGLGLSITYTIIQDMNGSIVAGKSKLGGAEFTVRLPLEIRTDKENG